MCVCCDADDEGEEERRDFAFTVGPVLYSAYSRIIADQLPAAAASSGSSSMVPRRSADVTAEKPSRTVSAALATASTAFARIVSFFPATPSLVMLRKACSRRSRADDAASDAPSRALDASALARAESGRCAVGSALVSPWNACFTRSVVEDATSDARPRALDAPSPRRDASALARAESARCAVGSDDLNSMTSPAPSRALETRARTRSLIVPVAAVGSSFAYALAPLLVVDCCEVTSS
mmetsp:Transcript_2488/g.6741  ORF Transcript_2488/g.6741 Transcript_2488/m.6741 type:complete len:238 (-) Transcript_2488:671-1384(-)